MYNVFFMHHWDYYCVAYTDTLRGQLQVMPGDMG